MRRHLRRAIGLADVEALQRVGEAHPIVPPRECASGSIPGHARRRADAMVGVNAEGRIVMANIQTEALFGYEPDELSVQLVKVDRTGTLKAAHPRHRADYFDDPKPRPMAAGIELGGLRADGTEFPRRSA